MVKHITSFLNTRSHTLQLYNSAFHPRLAGTHQQVGGDHTHLYVCPALTAKLFAGREMVELTPEKRDAAWKGSIIDCNCWTAWGNFPLLDRANCWGAAERRGSAFCASSR